MNLVFASWRRRQRAMMVLKKLSSLSRGTIIRSFPELQLSLMFGTIGISSRDSLIHRPMLRALRQALPLMVPSVWINQPPRQHRLAVHETRLYTLMCAGFCISLVHSVSPPSWPGLSAHFTPSHLNWTLFVSLWNGCSRHIFALLGILHSLSCSDIRGWQLFDALPI